MPESAVLMRRNFEPVAAAGEQLIQLVPVVGPVVGATVAAARERASVLRDEQTKTYLEELARAVERLSADKLNRAWLGSEEGRRVFLALGEASGDVLREEKVRFLAGAFAASASAPTLPAGELRRFNRLIIETDLDVLGAVLALARSFADRAESFTLKLPAFAREWNANEARGEGRLTEVGVLGTELLRDALAALVSWRLLDIPPTPDRGGIPPEAVVIYPREAWQRFASFLASAVDAVQL